MLIAERNQRNYNIVMLRMFKLQDNSVWLAMLKDRRDVASYGADGPYAMHVRLTQITYVSNVHLYVKLHLVCKSVADRLRKFSKSGHLPILTPKDS